MVATPDPLLELKLNLVDTPTPVKSVIPLFAPLFAIRRPLVRPVFNTSKLYNAKLMFPLKLLLVRLLLQVVPDIVSVVPPIIDILVELILMPHDVDELQHKDKIPVFIPVPFAINTVLPTVVIGFP